MLETRVLTALLLLPLILAALFFLPAVYWAALMTVAVLIGAREWAALSKFSGMQSVLYLVFTALACFFLARAEYPYADVSFYLIAAIFWSIVAPLWLRNKWRAGPLPIRALTGWLVLMPAWMALVKIQQLDAGLLLGLMAVVWIADSAAYFAGRRFGKHKLAPAISPGKTWEGVMGAFAGVTCYGLLWYWQGADAALFGAGLLGGLVLLWLLTAFSVLGDLFESWMKRMAGVKDSGRLLPGHGGVLDRIDALAAAMPLAGLGLFVLKNFHLA